jgi:hypothetical protein
MGQAENPDYEPSRQNFINQIFNYEYQTIIKSITCKMR